MLKRKIYWKHSPLSRDPVEHENFVREIMEIVRGITDIKFKFTLKCTGFEQHDRDPMTVVARSDSFNKFRIRFAYIDCIPFENTRVLTSSIGNFLKANDYQFNPITYAITTIIHEFGHIVYARNMFDNDAFDMYDYITTSNSHYVSLVLKEEEFQLAREGNDIDYLLSGSEMYSDGFAMTYFRAVTYALIERGFPEDLFTKEFSVNDCIKVDKETDHV